MIKGVVTHIGDAVALLSGLSAVGISVYRLWLPPDSTSGGDQLVSFTLLILSLVLIYAVIERRQSIDQIQNSLTKTLLSFDLGVLPLNNAQSVAKELRSLARGANVCIFAIGSKSDDSKYFGHIEEAVGNGAHYTRVLMGDCISHGLHVHLRNVLESEGAQVTWTEHEKYLNVVVTETGCVMAFPGGAHKSLTGISLPGQESARRYTAYVAEVQTTTRSVTDDKVLTAMCKNCTPGLEWRERLSRVAGAITSQNIPL